MVIAVIDGSFDVEGRFQRCVIIEIITAHKCVLTGAAQMRPKVPAIANAACKARIDSTNKLAVLLIGLDICRIDRGIQLGLVPELAIARFDAKPAILIFIAREFCVTGLVNDLVIGDRRGQTKV